MGFKKKLLLTIDQKIESDINSTDISIFFVATFFGPYLLLLHVVALSIN